MALALWLEVAQAGGVWGHWLRPCFHSELRNCCLVLGERFPLGSGAFPAGKRRLPVWYWQVDRLWGVRVVGVFLYDSHFEEGSTHPQGIVDEVLLRSFSTSNIWPKMSSIPLQKMYLRASSSQHASEYKSRISTVNSSKVWLFCEGQSISLIIWGLVWGTTNRE